MPFKSKAQRRKFYALKSQGKMTQETIDKWEAETPDGELPERISKVANVNFIRGFYKTAGGPGSGVSYNNTDAIDFLETSPLISIGYRQAFMDSHQPSQKNIDIETSKIKYKGQEKMVPKKVIKMMKIWDEVKDKPIDVIIDSAGNYHIIDGHHRGVAAILMKIKKIKANVYKTPKELE